MILKDIPLTCYAQSGELSIAYQTIGVSEIDLLIVPGVISQIEYLFEFPEYVRLMEHLSEFARVIPFDKSGQGLSDKSVRFPPFEQRMDDIQAVLDAVNCKKAVILGCSEGAPLSILFAATYPDRVSHLILFGGYPRMSSAPDYPYGITDSRLSEFLNRVDSAWGHGTFAGRFNPSALKLPNGLAKCAKLERLSAGPGAFKTAIRQISQIDTRPILPTVQTPTLILHRKRDNVVKIGIGELLAKEIPHARLIIYDDTDDHFIYSGDVSLIANDIREFVIGSRAEIETESERVLATVMVSDIVGSTDNLARIGDRSWVQILDEHDTIAKDAIREARGRFVATTGDGFVATFDGPSRAVRCAKNIISRLNTVGIQIRVGCHTGEIELRGEQIAGIAVHVAARIMALSSPGNVLVSRVLVDLIAGSSLRYESIGSFPLKGIEGTWELFSIA